MIIDSLLNAHLYQGLGKRFVTAFAYLQSTNFQQLPVGRYPIEEDNLFAMVNEYQTAHPSGEQMEAHRRYIDLQYLVSGTERIGHSLLQQQAISRPYDAEADYLLVATPPDFFSQLTQGMFAIFFPTDLHMPNLFVHEPSLVKKVVMKIACSG